MRMGSSANVTPPPIAPSWRMILWVMTLAPALLILNWSLRHQPLVKDEFAQAGLSANETERLKRILREPRDDGESRLQNDTFHVTNDSNAFEVSAEALSPAPLSGAARIDKSLLSSIKDNTFGITAADKPAYDAILAKVRGLSLADIEPMAHKDVPFALLMLDADRLRGEIVTIEGDIRRIQALSKTENQPSHDESFEAWLFTDDSGVNPYRVVLSSLPDGTPRGDELLPPIHARITGYFFKRYSYATANGFHTAPLVIAKTLTPLSQPKSTTKRSPGNSRKLTYLAIGVFAIFVVVVVVLEFSFQRRSRRRRISAELNESPPDLSWLKHDQQ